jgi:hypothetical protein
VSFLLYYTYMKVEKIPLFPADYNPDAGVEHPVWENPETPLFYEWFKSEWTKPESERGENFKKFLADVESGTTKLPFDLASLQIRVERERLQREG